MKTLLLVLILSLSGCALLNRYVPSQIDENGNTIAGTHDLTQPFKDVAHAIPYGDVVVGGLLLAWNFAERFRANKNSKGLLATVSAIKQAALDPATQEAVEKLKAYLKAAHNSADVRKLIDETIAKV